MWRPLAGGIAKRLRKQEDDGGWSGRFLCTCAPVGERWRAEDWNNVVSHTREIRERDGWMGHWLVW